MLDLYHSTRCHKTCRREFIRSKDPLDSWKESVGNTCNIPGSVFSYKLRYIVGFWLVEMAISTNQKPTIYRNLYENTAPDFSTCAAFDSHKQCRLLFKAKMKYLLTCKMNRYCILTLHGSILMCLPVNGYYRLTDKNNFNLVIYSKCGNP